MLELDPAQMRELASLDERAYVERVREQLLVRQPELAAEADLSARLVRALHVALAWGLDDDAQILSFLCLEALRPGFHRLPATRAWLQRPGRPVAERFADYLSVVRWSVHPPQ